MHNDIKIPYSWGEARPHEWEQQRVMDMLYQRGLMGTPIPEALGLVETTPEVTAHNSPLDQYTGLRDYYDTSPDYAPAGEAVRIVRLLVRDGWSKAQIARAAGVSKQLLSRLDRGSVRWVRVENLQGLRSVSAGVAA